MEPREAVTYFLIVLLIVIVAVIYRRRRRAVIRDRIARWGTAEPQHRYRRPGES